MPPPRDSIAGALGVLQRLGWTPSAILNFTAADLADVWPEVPRAESADGALVVLCEDVAALSPAILQRAEVCVVTCRPGEAGAVVLAMAQQGFDVIDLVRPAMTCVFAKRRGPVLLLCEAASRPI